jgi:hypothetical protein
MENFLTLGAILGSLLNIGAVGRQALKRDTHQQQEREIRTKDAGRFAILPLTSLLRCHVGLDAILGPPWLALA